MVIGLKPDKIEQYKQLHANAWPGVLEQLNESNIRNYSIFLQKIEGRYYLFSYFEYVGDNYQRDMKKMAADSVTQEWWKLTDSYQIPLDSRKQGEWWTTMEEVFHHE
ncbi:L-rhamnose mutarotase [Aliifodinibius sp. S!AR15-10]|uniref:L-rhamnose mutarotase n=1 Tax=Aliifodinibius sp. S!AR15-10 TaxID=2950437 RepID=UPI0038F66781